jgi:hypothetical protein
MAEMSPARKRVALAFVAIGIALIVQRTIASAGDADVVAPVGRGARSAAADTPSAAPPPGLRASAAPSPLRLDRLARTAPATAGEGGALFAVQSWQPPPPPPPPAEAVEPAVPPFPYPYMGGLTDERGRTAFFGRGDRVLAVRSGETIDGVFHVDQLNETSMTVTYVPLDKHTLVPLGGSQ